MSKRLTPRLGDAARDERDHALDGLRTPAFHPSRGDRRDARKVELQQIAPVGGTVDAPPAKVVAHAPSVSPPDLTAGAIALQPFERRPVHRVPQGTPPTGCAPLQDASYIVQLACRHAVYGIVLC